MKTLFLQQNHFPTLGIFFCGWGVDASTFSEWELPDDRDLLFVGEYDASDFSLSQIARSEYSRVDVAAWSLGVLVAAETLRLRSDFCGRRVAIAGSPFPYGAEFGIDAKIFDGTIENWLLPAARENFYRRVFGSRQAIPPQFFAERSPQNDVPDADATSLKRQTELRFLRELATRPIARPFVPTSSDAGFQRDFLAARTFDVAVVPRRDRIFQPAALERFWSQTSADVRFVDAPHYPFGTLHSWNEIFQ